MTDLCRLIFWTLVDLMRARATLEAEIWVLRQQINVLRRARPLRRFSRIASGRLLHAIGRPGRSLTILDSVDPAPVGLFGNKTETELLADHTGEKTAYRMLLPFCSHRDGGDRSAGWRPQHRKNAGVLGVGPRRGLW